MDLRQRERILDDSFAALRMVRLELDGLGTSGPEDSVEPLSRAIPWSHPGTGSPHRGTTLLRQR